MIHGISNFMASLPSFMGFATNKQRFPKPVSMTAVNDSNSTFGDIFFETEQTEYLFQARPIYSRIIKYLDLRGLSNLKQAISQTENMDGLALAINANHKERLRIMCTPKEFDIDSYMDVYDSLKDGRWALELNVSEELAQNSYSNVPDIKKVHSFHDWADMDGQGAVMSGVLANGDIFHLCSAQTSDLAPHIDATMTIVPGWDVLLTKLSTTELITFVRYMRTEHSPELEAKLRESKGNQAEIRAALIATFSSTTQG